MTSLAAFLAYLLLLPAHVRLVQINRALLAQAFRVLLDPETGQLRALEPHACAAVERALQIVEAGLSRAVWLFARRLAGLPCARAPTPLRTFAPRHGAEAAALLQRALDLQVQLDTFHARALRIIDELSWRERYSPAAHKSARDARLLTQVNSARGNPSPLARTAFVARANFARRVNLTSAMHQTGPPARAPACRLITISPCSSGAPFLGAPVLAGTVRPA